MIEPLIHWKIDKLLFDFRLGQVSLLYKANTFSKEFEMHWITFGLSFADSLFNHTASLLV
jgi:hypothetical protein